MVGSSLPVAVVSEGISRSLYNWKVSGLSSTIELSFEVKVRCDSFRVIDGKKERKKMSMTRTPMARLP